MLGDPSYIAAFITSTPLALAATVVAIALAVPASLALARYDFTGGAALSAMLLSPLVLPHVVLGAALLQYGAAIGLVRTFAALLVGHVIIVMPFVLRSILPLLTPEQRALEEASADLGARPVTTFFLVVLPQIRSGIVAGGLLALHLLLDQCRAVDLQHDIRAEHHPREDVQLRPVHHRPDDRGRVRTNHRRRGRRHHPHRPSDRPWTCCPSAASPLTSWSLP